MPELASSPDSSSLATRLADARRRLAALDLPVPIGAQLHRQFIAMCDSVKAPGADEEAAERRLAMFLAALDRAASGISGNGNSAGN
jgi:CRP-like cAMP-binding protein